MYYYKDKLLWLNFTFFCFNFVLLLCWGLPAVQWGSLLVLLPIFASQQLHKDSIRLPDAQLDWSQRGGALLGPHNTNNTVAPQATAADMFDQTTAFIRTTCLFKASWRYYIYHSLFFRWPLLIPALLSFFYNSFTGITAIFPSIFCGNMVLFIKCVLFRFSLLYCVIVKFVLASWRLGHSYTKTVNRKYP